MNWSDKLRLFRRRNNLKQDAVAAILDVSQAYVSRIESGVAQPSRAVRERLQSLLDQPAMRPVFDQLVALVTCSAAVSALLRCSEGRIVVEAASDASRTFGPPFSAQPVGAPLDVDIGDEGRARLAELVKHGVLTGEVACVDALWTYQGEQGVRYLRTTSTPVRPEPDLWLVLTNTVELTPEAYAALEAERGGPVWVRHY